MNGIRGIVWIAVTALCLGGCGVRKLNDEAKVRLDTIGIAPAQYRPVTIVPPAPATRSALVGQSTLHYAQTAGTYGSAPMVVTQGTPFSIIGATLSVLSSGVGATYGSVAGLLQRLPDPAQAQQKTADLQEVLATLDLQQQLAAIFLTEATTAPHSFKLLREIGPQKVNFLEVAISNVPSLFRPTRSTSRSAEDAAYQEFRSTGINSVLELAVDKLQFSGTEKKLALVLYGRARLLMPRHRSQSPEFHEFDTYLLDFHSDPHPYQSWSADDGALLQSVMTEELHAWSREVIAHWFE